MANTWAGAQRTSGAEPVAQNTVPATSANAVIATMNRLDPNEKSMGRKRWERKAIELDSAPLGLLNEKLGPGSSYSRVS
jgi:hypothetical protein